VAVAFGAEVLAAALEHRLVLQVFFLDPLPRCGRGGFPERFGSRFAPGGAVINGGSVRPKFRGRGIYRALVAARLDIARQAGVAGLIVWGGDMSGPILAGLGFETVGWRRFYVDATTV
jgi:GNAT superfamily N-acetyltransferase